MCLTVQVEFGWKIILCDIFWSLETRVLFLSGQFVVMLICLTFPYVVLDENPEE